MPKKFTIDTYAVIGNPISHSKSPFIHNEFAKQTGQQIQYLRIEAPLDGFVSATKEFQHAGGKGLNVTLPFKQQAYQFVSQRSSKAEQAEAVNTLIFNKDGSSLGDNTDGVGIVRDLTINLGFSLHNKKILIVGAGGAVRGILASLLAEQPKYIFIVNRTVAKAQELAEKFVSLGTVKGFAFDELPHQLFDLIINGTSASLVAELPPLSAALVSPDTFCYDLAYGDKSTAFLRWARQLGAKKCIDGIGMLIEQAAESFYIWRGVKPNTKSILEQLRKER